ncbi:MAG: hypothetical protein K9M11_00500 [Candidatus Pacebacteria bacterium]|nr:hypothetical protein [Candidatus Paceibacterota bacterium]
MEQKLFNKILFIISLGGVLFSGYLSSIKFFLKTCSFGETCPYFLGYPACYYGFALFLILFIVSILGLIGKIQAQAHTKTLTSISIVGVVFSGFFVVSENFKLSTCSLGLLFFIIIFIFSLRQLTTLKKVN